MTVKCVKSLGDMYLSRNTDNYISFPETRWKLIYLFLETIRVPSDFNINLEHFV